MNRKVFIPRLDSDWRLLFAPKHCGNYVNDHTLVQSFEGTWHLFGITSFGGTPADERYFVHAHGASLAEGTLTEDGKTIDHGTRAWAPCVISHEQKYFMYYGPSPTQLAVSPDLYEWMGYPVALQGEPFLAAHRDHMVLKINDYTWVMYVTGIKDGYGAISCFVSNDLKSWRFVQYALTSSGDAPLRPAWGAFESPYVVRHEGMYYLFATYTDCKKENYQNTLVFCSQNPYDFGDYTGDDSVCIARLNAHAAEVVYDPASAAHYITTCGWPGYGLPHEGGVSIARLAWVK